MLTPLAEPTDLADRLGVTFTTAQGIRAAALLADASAVVRNYTRQQFTVGTSTDVLEATADQWLYLPERPVTAIISVGVGGAPLAVGAWQLQNDALYRYDGWGSRFYGSTGGWNQPDTITVTYTHGYAEIPDDIVRTVCKLAETSWVNPQGLRSFTQGDMTATLALETVGSGALDADDRKILDFYRRPRRSVKLSAGIL